MCSIQWHRRVGPTLAPSAHRLPPHPPPPSLHRSACRHQPANKSLNHRRSPSAGRREGGAPRSSSNICCHVRHCNSFVCTLQAVPLSQHSMLDGCCLAPGLAARSAGTRTAVRARGLWALQRAVERHHPRLRRRRVAKVGALQAALVPPVHVVHPHRPGGRVPGEEAVVVDHITLGWLAGHGCGRAGEQHAYRGGKAAQVDDANGRTAAATAGSRASDRQGPRWSARTRCSWAWLGCLRPAWPRLPQRCASCRPAG